MTKANASSAGLTKAVRLSTSRKMCTSICFTAPIDISFAIRALADPCDSVQVNFPAESGEMGVLANHVPSIEQLKPGLVEVIEESAGSKQFFCTSYPCFDDEQ